MRVRSQHIWGCVLMGFFALGTGCAGESGMSGSGMETGKAMGGSLYERLGKKEAITAVVDDFVGRVANAAASTANLQTPIFPD